MQSPLRNQKSIDITAFPDKFFKSDFFLLPVPFSHFRGLRRGRCRSTIALFMACWLRLADMKSYLARVDEWMRTRLRMFIWKSPKTIGNKYRNLRKCGTDHTNAIRMANTRKGYRRSADSPIVKLAISKERLKKAIHFFSTITFSIYRRPSTNSTQPS